MRKVLTLVILTLFVVSNTPLFAAEEDSKKICPAIEKGQGMTMSKMKMMSMMQEMQGMMMDMMAVMKEDKCIKSNETMMKKMDEMMTRCKKMMGEADNMMSEEAKTKEGMMNKTNTEASPGVSSGHESHH